MRRALLPLLAAVAALGLAACGAGSSTSTASTSAQAGSSATTTAAGATTSPANSSPAPGPSKPSAVKRAGGAKSFVEPGADNSIPTFGSEAGASQRTQAETALRAYLTARARGDWAAACSYLSASTRAGVQRFAAASKGKPKGCAPVYAALSSGAPAAARGNPLSAPLAALRIKGKSAFALFYGPHNQQYVMPMASEGGAWKLTQLAPIAYPPGAQTPTSP